MSDVAITQLVYLIITLATLLFGYWTLKLKMQELATKSDEKTDSAVAKAETAVRKAEAVAVKAETTAVATEAQLSDLNKKAETSEKINSAIYHNTNSALGVVKRNLAATSRAKAILSNNQADNEAADKDEKDYRDHEAQQVKLKLNGGVK